MTIALYRAEGLSTASMTVDTLLDPLDWPLASTHSLALSVRRDIINKIFQLNLTEQDFRCRDAGLSAFFDDWFEEQCEAAASQLSVRTHRELLHIVAYIQSTDNSQHRSTIAARLHTTSSTARIPPELAPINASLTLAVRIWLSTSIDSLQHFLTPGHSVLWDSGRSLGDTIDEAFSPNKQSTEMVQLPRAFTAANLEKIAGIQVQWTSNLADHLSMKDDDTKVMLFHQASFLELHRESMWCVEDSFFSLAPARLDAYLIGKPPTILVMLASHSQKRALAGFTELANAMQYKAPPGLDRRDVAHARSAHPI